MSSTFLGLQGCRTRSGPLACVGVGFVARCGWYKGVGLRAAGLGVWRSHGCAGVFRAGIGAFGGSDEQKLLQYEA